VRSSTSSLILSIFARTEEIGLELTAVVSRVDGDIGRVCIAVLRIPGLRDDAEKDSVTSRLDFQSTKQVPMNHYLMCTSRYSRRSLARDQLKSFEHSSRCLENGTMILMMEGLTRSNFNWHSYSENGKVLLILAHLLLPC
jgi:hypothetical protein